MRLMNKPESQDGLTRRELLRRSTAGTAALGAALVFPKWVSAAGERKEPRSLHHQPKASANLYSDLLQTWCDGLVARQGTSILEPGLYGGHLCPGCLCFPGRCAVALYPLLRRPTY